MEFTTKTTNLGRTFGCRIYRDGVLILEGRCDRKDLIGATYRDMFRTLDKCGGNQFTSASRKRKFKLGNPVTNVKHIWHNLIGIL